MRRFWAVLSLPAFACSALGTAPTATPAVSAPAAAPFPTATASPLPLPGTATLLPTAAVVPDFPDPTGFHWIPVAAGLENPLDIQDPLDGSARLFIVEQPGRIRILQNGQLLAAPLLDITDRVESGSREQGLLGLALHPDFAANGLYFVNYTGPGGGTVIARFRDAPAPVTEARLLAVAQPFPNHNGGGMAFGPDGYLYLGLGDGGAAGDPFGNGQNQRSLLGKILRIDVDHGQPYGIPADNPFSTEVWHYGLRNPWRFSFDRQTGDLYIADVGQDVWEEIDLAPAGTGGLNFGWKTFEGSHPYARGSAAGLSMPIAEYDHDHGCSVTGGYVYRGSMPEWQGVYFYGDYCSGRIWGLLNSGLGWHSRELFRTDFRISTFGQDALGELYLADLEGGIYRLDRR